MLGKSLETMRILLVEPSIPQAKIIMKELNKAGIISVAVSSDAHNAMFYIEDNQPDLVISSMFLPDVTALELIQRIRHSEVASETPFMLISSVSSWEELDPIKQAGVAAILPKPFSSEQLRRALLNTMELVNPGELDLDAFDASELKILVVDDSRMARNHIIRVLKGLSVNEDNIYQAENGREAIPIIEEQYLDLIVTDYNMPEMDGKELTEYVRTQSSQQTVPMLMVTSEQGESRLEAVQQAGISALCDKPFEADTVRQALQMMLAEV